MPTPFCCNPRFCHALFAWPSTVSMPTDQASASAELPSDASFFDTLTTDAVEARTNARPPKPIWPDRLRRLDSPVQSVDLPSIDRADASNLDQDTEWCRVALGEERSSDIRRIRFHDYTDIFDIPGLYEKLFYETLECCSPSRVVHLLSEVLEDAGESIADLRCLDVGAGNGMVADELKLRGAKSIVGVDIIPAARNAALRDRPGVYDDYLVADLTDLDETQEHVIRQRRLTALTLVAALGFGDIPPAAFLKALDLVETPSWIAFNVKERFLLEREPGSFGAIVHDLVDAEVLRFEAYRRYGHRLSVDGRQLHYVGIVAKKLKDVPDHLLRTS